VSARPCTDTPRLRQFQVPQFQTYGIRLKNKDFKKQVFEAGDEFSLMELKAQ
jgi:hypothetical protein